MAYNKTIKVYAAIQNSVNQFRSSGAFNTFLLRQELRSFNHFAVVKFFFKSSIERAMNLESYRQSLGSSSCLTLKKKTIMLLKCGWDNVTLGVINLIIKTWIITGFRQNHKVLYIEWEQVCSLLKSLCLFLSAGQSMRHATDADADTDCVFVILLMFPLDSPALVPTAAPPSLLSEVHLESQCSTDLALLHSQPSYAPPAQLWGVSCSDNFSVRVIVTHQSTLCSTLWTYLYFNKTKYLGSD